MAGNNPLVRCFASGLSPSSILTVVQRPHQEFNKYHENPDHVIRDDRRRRFNSHRRHTPDWRVHPAMPVRGYKHNRHRAPCRNE